MLANAASYTTYKFWRFGLINIGRLSWDFLVWWKYTTNAFPMEGGADLIIIKVAICVHWSIWIYTSSAAVVLIILIISDALVTGSLKHFWLGTSLLRSSAHAQLDRWRGVLRIYLSLTWLGRIRIIQSVFYLGIVLLCILIRL